MNATDTTSQVPTFRTPNPNLTATLGFIKFLTLAALVTLALMFTAGGILVALGATPSTDTTPAAAATTATTDRPAGDGPLGCWNEPNSTQPGGFELIQGPISAAPVGSVIADCPTR